MEKWIKNTVWKQKKIRIVWLCAVVMTFLCIIRMMLPNQVYHYSGERIFDDGIIREEEAVYEHIALPMGIYDVVLEYQSDTSLKNLCTVKDGTVFSGGLLTNGECLHKNLTSTDYRMWLFEGTEELQVCISYAGVGYIVAGNLEIRETDVIWLLFMTLIWTITLLVTVILYLREYDRTVGIEKDKKNVMFGLAVIIIIASIPFLHGGRLSSADVGYHCMRIEGVKDGILSGQFPLRLEPEWVSGHGYANSIFYCNTLLYFPAILRLLGFTVTASYNLYCIAINIATVCIGYYCFSRIFKNCYVGMLCSGLHTLSIFRIYKFVTTGALGEGSAFTFMPLVLYGFYRVFSEEPKSKQYKTSWIPIAVGYAGLIQTHVLSCEITALLTILVCVAFMKKIFVKETFMELAKGVLAALAASIWYLVPFLDYYMNEDLHIHHVSARTIQDRGLYLPVLFFNWWKLGNNAVLGDEGMTEAHAMGIGLILGIGFFVFCIMWFLGQWKKDNLLGLAKVCCVLGGMLMLMSLNIFPWDAIQNINGLTASLVSSIQFPNRFLGWGTVFLTIVCGYLLWYFQKQKNKFHYYLSVICILAGLCTSSIYLMDYICHEAVFHNIYNEEGMGFGYISGAEYIVEGTDQDLLDFNNPVEGANVEITKYEKEYLHVRLKCVNRSPEQSYLEVPILHYKGYQAYRTDTGEKLEVRKGDNNVVRVLIPAGFQGEIEIKFVSPVSWRVSELITYGWWVFAAGLCLKRCKRKNGDVLCGN